MPKGVRGFQKGTRKGIVTNPQGTPIGKGVITMRRMTADEYRDLVTVLLEKDIPQLQEIIKDPKSKSLHVFVATIMLKGIQDGDHRALEALLNRVMGRVKIEVDNTSSDGSMTPRQNVLVIPYVPNTERKAIVAGIAKQVELTADEEVKKR